MNFIRSFRLSQGEVSVEAEDVVQAGLADPDIHLDHQEAPFVVVGEDEEHTLDDLPLLVPSLVVDPVELKTRYKNILNVNVPI